MATINRKYDSNNLNPRELQLFQFLWKWQVSSASLLVRHGCPDLPTGFVEGRLRKFNDVHVYRKESFDNQLRGFMITSRDNRCVQEMAGDYNDVSERSYLFEELLLIQVSGGCPWAVSPTNFLNAVFHKSQKSKKLFFYEG